MRLVVFLQGVSAMAAWSIAAFFLRYFRDSRDHLFAYFGSAFVLLGLSWAMLSLDNPVGDASPYVYGLRLVAFLLIIAAVVQKNAE